MRYLSLLSLLPLLAFCKMPESYYQDQFASRINGQTEVIAGDGTRCDILTDEYAIEVDFARKWGEAIGQSLNYGFQFNRKPGILLILEKPDDRKHYIRINSLVKHYSLPIKVWTITAAQEPQPSPKAYQPSPPSQGDYWISSTGKTHRHGCRYYGKGNGKYSSKASGNNCKVCGGAR